MTIIHDAETPASPAELRTRLDHVVAAAANLTPGVHGPLIHLLNNYGAIADQLPSAALDLGDWSRVHMDAMAWVEEIGSARRDGRQYGLFGYALKDRLAALAGILGRALDSAESAPAEAPQADLIADAAWHDLHDAIEAAGYNVRTFPPTYPGERWVAQAENAYSVETATGPSKRETLAKIATLVPSAPTYLAALAEGRKSEAQEIVDGLVAYAAATDSSTSNARRALVVALHVGQGHTVADAVELALYGSQADVPCGHPSCIREARDLADGLIEKSRRAALSAIDDARESWDGSVFESERVRGEDVDDEPLSEAAQLMAEIAELHGIDAVAVGR